MIEGLKLRFVTRWLLVLGLFGAGSAWAQNWETGDTSYHAVCSVSCHNTNPRLAGPTGPAIDGTSARDIQDAINDGMGDNGGVAPTTRPYVMSGMAIHSTVTNIAAYLSNIDYPKIQLTGTTSGNIGDILTNETATVQFTIRNNRSGANPLVISSITPSSGAIRASQNCVGFANRIFANGTCTVTVTLNSATAGNYSVGVTVNHNAQGGSTFVGTYTGSISTPVAGFSRSPATLSLTARANSTERDTGTVFVSNPSSATANLILSGFTFSATRFTRSGGTCVIGGTGMAPGAPACTIIVQYAADGTTGQSGTLTIGHNSPSPTTGNTVTLNATGTISTISPTTGAPIDFGDVQTGVATVSPTRTISNLGTATLNFRAPTGPELPTLSGPNASQFSLSGCSTTLQAPPSTPSSCNFTVTFTPTAPSAGDSEPRSATLTFYSDATNNGGKATFALSGNAVTLPPPTVTTLPLADFPETVINENAAQTRTVTLTNPRTRDVTFTVNDLADFLVVGNTCPSASKVGSTSSGRVTGGGTSCTLTLRFRPAVAGGAGRRTGSFSIAFAGTGGDPSPAAIPVAVAGDAKLPLKLSPTSLTPAAVVGSPTLWTVTVTNEASTPITLTSLGYSGAQGTDYSLDATSVCVNGYVLAASSSCALVTRFNPPNATNPRNGTLTITHTGVAGSPQTVTLNGTATPAPQGRIELSDTALAFPDTQLDGTSAITVTLSNAGNLALNFTSFAITGAQASDFTRSGTCAVGTPVPYVVGGPAATCTVVVTFAPGALGARSASLTIRSDATNDPVAISLAGTGIPIPVPVVTTTPTALAFGNQTIGGLYPARRVRLSNTGTASLAVSSIAVSGTGYSIVSSACPSVLAVGAGCDIDILLAATEARLYPGTLTIVDNAAGSPHTVALTGTGVAAAVPVLTWSPMVTTLDFGMVSAGSVSAVQTVTVLNQGPGGATLTLLNATGPDSSAFSVTGGTCNLTDPLFEGASCTVNIVFSPGSAGTKTAQVQVASTGSFPTTLTLTGIGMAGPNPAFSLSTSSLNLGSVRVGAQSIPQVVRLVSGGDGTVNVTAMATEGPFTIFGTTCPPTPFSLPSGSDCTVSVAYNAGAEGSAAGTLRITTDATPAVREVALAGTGTGNADVTDGGGGCAIGGGNGPADPTLWLLLLAAIGVLLERERRRRQARLAARRTAQNREVAR